MEQIKETNDFIVAKNCVLEHLRETKASNKDINDWFLIAINGSWNYDLETPESDIDTKLLVVPSWKDLIQSKQKNYLHIQENGEHTEVKDFRSYFKTMMKQNINFVETLYAKIVFVNPKYQEEWDMIQEIRDAISFCNPRASVNCMVGMMIQKSIDMYNITPGREWSINKYGYDLKSFHHMMRLFFFLEDFVNLKSYEKCLRPDISYCRQYLKDIKTGDVIYTLGQLKELTDEIISNAKYLRKTFLEEIEPYQEAFDLQQELIYDILDAVIESIIKKSLGE